MSNVTIEFELVETIGVGWSDDINDNEDGYVVRWCRVSNCWNRTTTGTRFNITGSDINAGTEYAVSVAECIDCNHENITVENFSDADRPARTSEFVCLSHFFSNRISKIVGNQC